MVPENHLTEAADVDSESLMLKIQQQRQSAEKRRKSAEKLCNLLLRMQKLIPAPVDNAYDLQAIELELDSWQATHGEDEELEVLRGYLVREGRAWRQETFLRFGREVIACFRDGGFELRLRDKAFIVEGYVIQPDFGVGTARLLFAREELHKSLPLKPQAIYRAFLAARKEINDRRFEPEGFIAGLFEAYRRVCRLEGIGFGQRVNIVQLLGEFAFVRQSDTFRRDPARSRYRGYGRTHFSHDLNCLRQSGILEHNGYRLNIGTATIDFSGDPRHSLYLTDGKGGGNFIMYISFIKKG